MFVSNILTSTKILVALVHRILFRIVSESLLQYQPICMSIAACISLIDSISGIYIKFPERYFIRQGLGGTLICYFVRLQNSEFDANFQ